MISNRIPNLTKPTTHNRLKPPVKLSLKFNVFQPNHLHQTIVKFLKVFSFYSLTSNPTGLFFENSCYPAQSHNVCLKISSFHIFPPGIKKEPCRQTFSTFRSLLFKIILECTLQKYLSDSNVYSFESALQIIYSHLL